MIKTYPRRLDPHQCALGSATALLAAGLVLILLIFAAAAPALAGPFQPRSKDKDKTPPAETPATDSSTKDPDAGSSTAPADAQPAAEPAVPATGAPRPTHADAPPIPLRGNLRMVIRPTILGLVPNRDPEGYGEVFARVLAADGSRAQLYFEVKEFVKRSGPRTSWLASLQEDTDSEGAGGTTHAPAAGNHAPVPEIGANADPQPRELMLADFGHRIEETRIRRGELNFSGLDSAAMASPPLFWGDGPWQASGSGIWLSRALLAQLKQSGQAVWQRFEMYGPPAPANAEAASLIVIKADAKYPCVVNGARVMLPALYCRDSLGLAEYWIHDDPANPLLLKLSFLPPEGMKPIESIVELDESDAPADGRDPRLPKLLVKRDGGDSSGIGAPIPSGNQFGGQRQAPPDVQRAERLDDGGEDDEGTDEDEADEESGAADETAGRTAQGPVAAPGSNAGIDTGAGFTGALPGAPLSDYSPPGIDELVACGGGYAIVEIDF